MPENSVIAYGKVAPVIFSLGAGIKVVRLSRSLVLKSGTSVLASEGETMSYIAKTFPKVRLPRVHRYFNVARTGSYLGTEGYIIMDYVDGPSLDSCWEWIHLEAQMNIVTQVADMINELQSKRSDTPGVIGGSMSRGKWFSDYGAGPFPTKEIFEKWINWKLALSQYYHQAAMDIPPIECPYFVLTHGDITPRNLIVDADKKVWLIDWGCAGFYPPIFEAASAKHQHHFESFAKLLLPLIHNDPDEMKQLESCSFGINRVVFSLPPGMAPAYGTEA